MTNREKLIAMTDEQLANFIVFGDIDGKSCCTRRCNGKSSCVECMTEWLRTENNPKKGDVRKEKVVQDVHYMNVRTEIHIL